MKGGGVRGGGGGLWLRVVEDSGGLYDSEVL